MNADQVATLRALLAPTGWVDRTSAFARALRRSARTPSGLLIFGPAGDEPWHMAAHLADESEYAGIPELAPTLVRWAPEPGAPAHLSVGLSRLAAATPQETLLVVSRGVAPERLLERVHDVRRSGATVFAIDQDDPELDDLAHESLQVSPDTAPISFEAAQHLVTAAVGDVTAAGLLSEAIQRAARPAAGAGGPADAGRGMRARLARLLDTVTGTPDD
jgi:hypothetical protein